MPEGITKELSTDQFTDLIEYLTTLKQKVESHPGVPEEIRQIETPVRLEPLHSAEMKFDHPVWIIANAVSAK